MFESLSDRLNSALRNLKGKGRLTDEDINSTAREIRLALLDADVSLPVVRGFIKRVKTRAKGAEVHSALNPAQQFIKIVDEELTSILGGEARRINFAKTPPTVIMLAGLQGAGKTTLAGKLAKYLTKNGHTPMLVACDLQRPGAVSQLQIVGQKAGVPVFAPNPGTSVDAGESPLGTTSGDPAEVARQSLDEARRKVHDVVIIDTAGRLGVDEVLMEQARSIRDAVNPDEIFFVLDAMIGQDAVTTAEAFRDGVGFTGVVLTKLDGDARGGAALSVREMTGVPIMFASTGEQLDDFDVFHPDRMSSRILGMGDLLTLIEQAEQVFDQQEAEKSAEKMMSGELTLEDFLDQLLMIRKMGPLSNILGMMPGGKEMQQAAAMVDEKHLDRIQAIIRGMTPAERAKPEILNASRRRRIANGSGVTVREVNELVNRFMKARKLMNRMSNTLIPGGNRRRKGKKGKKGKNRKKQRRQQGMPNIPGMPGGLPGGMPDLSNLPGGLGKMPPGLEGVDLSKLKFPKF